MPKPNIREIDMCILFDNNIHLFATNDNVHNHNRKKLHSLKKPVAHSITSKEGSTNPREGKTDELDVELLLAKDARVMLTSNLWIEARLVNGALGYCKNLSEGKFTQESRIHTQA